MKKELKSYAAPWQGRLVLACRKCQKKLKKDEQDKALGNLKKTVKRHEKLLSDKKLHIMNVSCMNLCPKNAVAVCVPELACDRLFLIRAAEDIDILYP